MPPPAEWKTPTSILVWAFGGAGVITISWATGLLGRLWRLTPWGHRPRAEVGPVFVNTVAPVFNMAAVEKNDSARSRVAARIDEEEYEGYRTVLPLLRALETALEGWRTATRREPDRAATDAVQRAWDGYVNPVQTWQSILDSRVRVAHAVLMVRLRQEAGERMLVGTLSFDQVEAARSATEVSAGIFELRRTIEDRIIALRNGRSADAQE